MSWTRAVQSDRVSDGEKWWYHQFKLSHTLEPRPPKSHLSTELHLLFQVESPTYHDPARTYYEPPLPTEEDEDDVIPPPPQTGPPPLTPSAGLDDNDSMPLPPPVDSDGSIPIYASLNKRWEWEPDRVSTGTESGTVTVLILQAHSEGRVSVIQSGDKWQHVAAAWRVGNTNHREGQVLNTQIFGRF